MEGNLAAVEDSLAVEEGTLPGAGTEEEVVCHSSLWLAQRSKLCLPSFVYIVPVSDAATDGDTYVISHHRGAM